MEEPEDGQPVWQRAIEELAAREDVEPSGLDTPLGAVIDPAAAESVLSSARERGTAARVAFEYLDYEVTLHSDGRVVVDETDAADD